MQQEHTCLLNVYILVSYIVYDQLPTIDYRTTIDFFTKVTYSRSVVLEVCAMSLRQFQYLPCSDLINAAQTYYPGAIPFPFISKVFIRRRVE
jgi:hypothetical protein